jgi:hypothetical protein
MRIQNVGSPATPDDPYRTFAVEYSHAFGDVEHLICEYQSCLKKIKPLLKEDVLFLLLDGYAKSTGNGVYIEIKRPTDIQFYDSDVKEPMVRFEHLHVPRRTLKFRKQTAAHLEQMTYGSPGVSNTYITSDTHEDYKSSTAVDVAEQQGSIWTSSNDAAEVTITLNFPDMLVVEDTVSSNNGLPPYTSALQDHREFQECIDGGREAEAPQTFEVEVHRCHHEGIESQNESDGSQLPVGFSDAIQRMGRHPLRVS